MRRPSHRPSAYRQPQDPGFIGGYQWRSVLSGFLLLLLQLVCIVGRFLAERVRQFGEFLSRVLLGGVRLGRVVLLQFFAGLPQIFHQFLATRFLHGVPQGVRLGQQLQISKPTLWTWQPLGECYLPKGSALVFATEHPAGRALIIVQEAP